MNPPTPMHLLECRALLEDLGRLFREGGERGYAATVSEALSVEGGVEKLVTSFGFWGGMGSIVDCAFCSFNLHHNRRAFEELIVTLGKHQVSASIYTPLLKPHIDSWVGIFENRR